MDPAFAAYLRLDRKWAAETLKQTPGRMQLLASRGLDWSTFSVDNARLFLADYHKHTESIHAFNLAVRTIKAYGEWLDLDMRKVKAHKAPRSHYKYLSTAQDAALLALRHPNPRIETFQRALTLWGRKSAMRVGEVHGMQIRDLDRSMRPARFFVRKPSKRGLQRWLPVETWVLSPKRAVGAYLAHLGEHGLDETAPLWQCMWDERGRPSSPVPFTKAGLGNVMQDITANLGFRVNFTITRHSRATELRRMGWDLFAVQHYLGHADISSTQVYAGVSPDDLHRLMSTRGTKDPFAKES